MFVLLNLYVDSYYTQIEDLKNIYKHNADKYIPVKNHRTLKEVHIFMLCAEYGVIRKDGKQYVDYSDLSIYHVRQKIAPIVP